MQVINCGLARPSDHKLGSLLKGQARLDPLARHNFIIIIFLNPSPFLRLGINYLIFNYAKLKLYTHTTLVMYTILHFYFLNNIIKKITKYEYVVIKYHLPNYMQFQNTYFGFENKYFVNPLLLTSDIVHLPAIKTYSEATLLTGDTSRSFAIIETTRYIRLLCHQKSSKSNCIACIGSDITKYLVFKIFN